MIQLQHHPGARLKTEEGAFPTDGNDDDIDAVGGIYGTDLSESVEYNEEYHEERGSKLKIM